MDFSIEDNLIFKRRELNKTTMDFQKDKDVKIKSIENHHLPRIKENPN